MSYFLHIVCPHCATVNRLQAERLNEQPSCGKCSRAIFTANAGRMVAWVQSQARTQPA